LFPAPAPIPDAIRQGVDLRSRNGQLFRVLSLAVGGRSQGDDQILQIAMDRSSDEDVAGRSSRVLMLVLAIAMIVSLSAGYLIAHRGMRPVNAMAETAATVRTGTLGERLKVDGLPSELGALAATFNEMLARLEESFTRLSRFSADIAHELRTPLNNLRGEAEVALRTGRSREDVLSSSLEEYDRMSRIIESLLFLARAESPEMQLKRERLDIKQELETIREFYEAAAQEKGVEIRVEVPAPAAADLDRTLFQRALGNLVSNALAHTPQKGSIVLRAVSEARAIRVEVVDNGTGIAPGHLSKIFERFYRADGARSRNSGGVGLGLAIVQSIAAVHRGSAGIQSEPGRGTTVRLVFPR
jgi:two-component system, OmpR family, heavy metal sensor histidine kinase CusS